MVDTIFSTITEVKSTSAQDKVPMFLAMTTSGIIFACPIHQEGKEKKDPFPILTYNSDENHNLNLEDH